MNTNRVSRQYRRGSVIAGLSLGGAVLLLAGCGGGGSSKSNNPLIPQSYSIADLGTLPGGTSSIAAALNNQGEVVGTSTQTSANGASTDQAFVWKNGQMTALGILPGGRASQATGISDGEQVCGNSDTGNGERAFLYMNGTLTDIGSLPNDVHSTASGVNAHGQVALSSAPDAPTPSPNSYPILPSHAAVYDNGALMEIKIPVGDIAITPTAINAAGQVIGTSINQNKVSRAFLYQNGSLSFLGMLPGDGYSEASGLNANSQAVGSSSVQTGTDPSGQYPTIVSHAALFTGGKVIGLGALPGDTQSVAMGINDNGQIIGDSINSAATDFNNYSHPFVWQQGQLVDLNGRLSSGSGWTLNVVTGINNAGQICGSGLHNGQSRDFLLTPQ